MLALWQIISMSIDYPAIFPNVPGLMSGVFSLFTKIDFYIAISATIFRGLIGFLISTFIALALALLALKQDFFKSFFHPFLVLTRSIPVIAIVLFALLWFSPNNLPIFIALITMFPILYQNILSGLEHVDIRLIEMATVFGKSKLTQLTDIYLPSAKKIIVSGISTAMGFGWRAIIIGEVLAQPMQGIGSRMKHAQAFINIPELLAWTFTAILISYLFEFLLKKWSNYRITTYSFNTEKKIKNKPFHKSNLKSIEIENITKSFNNVSILKKLNLHLDSKMIHYIKAPSGKGKTTLLRIISGSESFEEGKITSKSTYRYAFSYQDSRLLPWLNLKENIAFAFDHPHKISAEQSKELEVLMEQMELQEHANKFPHELSGGQQQRIGLARALAARSDVLLLDEPLNGLDDRLKQKIVTLIVQWTMEYQPIIVWATHEEIMMDGKLSNDLFIA
jgi:ABC-type nitrate/sulfonate/bicarbonate transport system ATPase subunit/ABC-type nitrate/sulfonate/bicarbonate transport system permease component